MSFRLVLKSVTLNDLERRNGSYFALFHEFAKPALQLITASSSIELIDQKSASVTHRAVNLACQLMHYFHILKFFKVYKRQKKTTF